MAKKNKGIELATLPAAEKAELQDFNAVLGDAVLATGRLSGAAATANLASGRTGTRAGLNDLENQGFGLANPLEQQAINAYKAANPITSQMLVNQQTLTDNIARWKARLESGTSANGKPLTKAQIATLNKNIKGSESKLTKLTNTIDTRTKRVEDFTAETRAGKPTAADVMRQADPEFYANVDRAQGIADTIGQMTPEGRRFLDAAGQGYRAGTIGSRDVTASQMGAIANVGAQQVQASRMGNFGTASSRDITAGQVGAGQLGQSLMQRAMGGIERGGLLSQQATRDAIQSARQGFAARGLATGNSALGAELLNRDRYARQREMEDLQFAGGVQAQDISRQFQNVGNQLAADQANQSAALQAELANLQARYNAAAQEGNWQQAAAIANQEALLRADMSNQQTAFNTGQFNAQQANAVNLSNADRSLNAATANENAQRLGAVTNNEMLYNAAGYSDALKTQGLGASLQMAGVQQAANPLMRAITFDPYGTRGLGAQAMPIAGQLAGGVADTNARIGMFNAGAMNDFAMANWNAQNWANAAQFYPSFQSGIGGGGGMGFNTGGAVTGALSGAATGAMIGSVVPGVGTAVGAIGGAIIGGAGGGLSDRREKADIKPLGKVTSVLDLPAYEYRYKGEKQKRKGVMAQDVAKVLPDAVREVNYRGKKRLAIKPDVIGAALAQELIKQTKAIAA